MQLHAGNPSRGKRRTISQLSYGVCSLIRRAVVTDVVTELLTSLKSDKQQKIEIFREIYRKKSMVSGRALITSFR